MDIWFILALFFVQDLAYNGRGSSIKENCRDMVYFIACFGARYVQGFGRSIDFYKR